MSGLKPLSGLTVGVTADRRRHEQAELLERLGASVMHGPTVRTLPLAHEDGAAAATRSLIERPPQIVAITTGIGMRSWLSLAESLGVDDELVDALRGAEVLVRGPKAAGACVAAGLEISWQTPSETSAELLDQLLARPLSGCRVAVQRDGAPTATLADAVRAAGADVVDVPVYRWTEPEDATAALRLLDAALARRLDAVTFTSSPAVWNLVSLAESQGRANELLETLNTSVLAVCVGPVCAASAERVGITRVVQPRRGRLGAMVAALAAAGRNRRRSVTVSGRPGVLQGAVLDIAGRTFELTQLERSVIEALTDRPGAVVSKSELLRRCWSDRSADPHTVEVTVGRLRRRLGDAADLETVPRRGYRLVP